MARTWTRLREHLGCPPGPLTFDMVRQAAEDNLEETDDLDWKEMLPQPPRDGRWNELAKDVAAMANTRGGLIIFGVQDKTTALVGIDPEEVNRQQYAQWIRNHVQPYLPDLDIFELTGGTKTVLVVDVPASEMAPHFVHGGAARDKEQQAAVVPYRDNDHTAWMAESRIERAYRDRFARVGQADEEIQRHIDFTTQTIAAHASVPSAWFVAVSRPQRPLPRSAYTMSCDEAREVLEAAQTRARHLNPREPVSGPLVGMGPDTRLNPRPGLRRWVCNNLASPINREIRAMLRTCGSALTEGCVPSRWIDRQVIEQGRRCTVGREGTPVLTVVNEDGSSLLDEIVREGARRMLAAALEAEVNAYIAELADERDETGRRLVVRNGYHRPREVTTAAGAVEVKAPRVNDKRIDPDTGERKRFSSAILPPWCRKSPKISEVLPLLYLHGLSSGDFVPALEQFLGSSAGLSPATVTRLTAQWQADHKAFGERDLTGADYVYVWADGIHLRIRLTEAKSCVLVVMGVRADGTKELIAMADGYRESAESWADLLRDAARRGMRAPVLAVGDGALGFWKALAEVFPETRHQRCWVHKTANVLNALPKSAQSGARKALQDIYNAEDHEHAVKAVAAFDKTYGVKWPKAARKITDDVDELLAFYDLPAEHWVHLRTTNLIESTFATVRLRTKVTKGAGSAAAALAMVFKLVESAQARWRAVNAPHLVALVRAGARFERGHLVERSEAHAA